MAKSNFIETKKALDDITSAIDSQIASATKLNGIVIQLNANYTKVPTEYVSVQNKIIQQTNEVAKSEQKVQKELERTRLAQIKLAQDREKAFDKYEKQLQREQAKLEAANSLYQKVQTRLNTLQKEYRDLATMKELGATLTDKETKRYNELEGKIKKYDTTLKAVDASMGKYQRNVGNYASGYNGLGTSVSRIAQELPNAAQSFQIFAMSIGNNIAAVKDSVSELIARNKALKAEGKETTSVLSQVGTSLLSWNTALYIGIALFIAYSKEIATFTKELFGASEALEQMTARQDEFNSSRLTGRKDAQSEIIELQKYLAVVKDDKLLMEQRQIALKALRSQYPYYFKNLSDAQILAGQTAKAESELTKALEKRKEVEKKTELNVQNRQALIDLNNQLDAAKKLEAIKQRDLDRGIKQGISAQALATYSNDLNKAQKARISLENQISAINKQTIKNDSDIIRLKKETIALEYQEEKAKKEVKREKLEAIELNKKDAETQNALIKGIEDQIKYFEMLRDTAATDIIQYREFDKAVKDLRLSLDLIRDPKKFMSDPTKELQAQQELLKKHAEGWELIQKKMESYAQSFTDSFIANSGFKTTFDILNDKILGFGSNAKVTALAITESFQEMFNFISQASQANFDAEYRRLDDQKNIAIKFAGDNAAAKEEIEKQYQERQRRLRRQEAETKKKEAIMNIAIDTAQALIGLWVKPGFPAAIPLMALVGGLGLAQIAMVQSQEIPNYAEGTDNHIGGAMLINDEKGSNYQELVETPDGKKRIYKGRNVLVNAPKGTKVHTATETQMMFDHSLSRMLIGNGIEYAQPQTQSNGLTDAHVSRIERALSNVPTSEILFDESGIRKWRKQNGIREQILNNKLHGRITSRG